MTTRAWLLAALAAAAPAAAAAAPATGHYDAWLCVATGTAAKASCGAATVDVRRGGRIEVRVFDIAYRLTLRSSQLDASTTQGTTQIDEFSADYEWAGGVLRFRDAGKGVTYEVRLQSPRQVR